MTHFVLCNRKVNLDIDKGMYLVNWRNTILQRIIVHIQFSLFSGRFPKESSEIKYLCYSSLSQVTLYSRSNYNYDEAAMNVNWLSNARCPCVIFQWGIDPQAATSKRKFNDDISDWGVANKIETY